MSTIAVDPTLCKRDGICVAVCPARYLGQDANGLPVALENAHCIECGHCVAVCKSQALTHHGLPQEALQPMPAAPADVAALDGLLASRRSIRTFRPEPVDRSTLESLFDLARRAPTATNSQLLEWIVVNGCQAVHAVAESIVDGMRQAGVSQSILDRWDAGDDFALRDAPTLVVCTAPSEYFWGREDGAIALTFLELAAEARGLGACWAGYLTRCAARHLPLRQLLGVPEGRLVVGGLMLGRPRHSYHRVPPRKPAHVQWN